LEFNPAALKKVRPNPRIASAYSKESLMPPKITVYTSSTCSDCRKLKTRLDTMGVNYLEKNVEEDPLSLQYLLEKTRGKKITPVLEIDGKVLIDPKPETLTALLNPPT
jgi:glutaredoxin